MVQLNIQAPMFKAMAYHNDEFKEVSLEDYKGKFVVLFFYPADFTFVCPTELEDMAEKYPELQKLGVEVLSISTDTHFVHKAWHDTSERIKKITFPMVADPDHTISKAYEVLRAEGGVADRATFVIDPDGIIKAIEITDEPIGRNADELVRKIQALEYARNNPGQACPAKWKPGAEVLKPGLDLVGKL
jgi:peroxiredoxin (alkyl hydroperoxide reductase subunit C)